MKNSVPVKVWMESRESPGGKREKKGVLSIVNLRDYKITSSLDDLGHHKFRL